MARPPQGRRHLQVHEPWRQSSGMPPRPSFGYTGVFPNNAVFASTATRLAALYHARSGNGHPKDPDWPRHQLPYMRHRRQA